MFDLTFPYHLSKLQSEWVFAFYRCSVEAMDALLVEAEPTKTVTEPEKVAQENAVAETAMKRLQSGFAPPREIYDIRNRGRINWGCAPAWAWPTDPELFEGGHEG